MAIKRKENNSTKTTKITKKKTVSKKKAVIQKKAPIKKKAPVTKKVQVKKKTVVKKKTTGRKKISVKPVSNQSVETPSISAEERHNKIATMAYHRWLNRGCLDGYNEYDWLQCEKIVDKKFGGK